MPSAIFTGATGSLDPQSWTDNYVLTGLLGLEISNVKHDHIDLTQVVKRIAKQLQVAQAEADCIFSPHISRMIQN